mgnify:CR=1 FL=1
MPTVMPRLSVAARVLQVYDGTGVMPGAEPRLLGFLHLTVCPGLDILPACASC